MQVTFNTSSFFKKRTVFVRIECAQPAVSNPEQFSRAATDWWWRSGVFGKPHHCLLLIPLEAARNQGQTLQGMVKKEDQGAGWHTEHELADGNELAPWFLGIPGNWGIFSQWNIFIPTILSNIFSILRWDTLGLWEILIHWTENA